MGSSFSPGDAEWYGNQMYKPDHPAFKYHQQKFGDQHQVGFKDIIPRFTGEKFDAETGPTFSRGQARNSRDRSLRITTTSLSGTPR